MSNCNEFEFTSPQGTFYMDGGIRGKDGVTFYPHVSAAGILSWTNDGGKQNPDPVNIKGADGMSAYAAAQQAGFTGTEAQFNAYLSGIGTLTEDVDDLKSAVTADADIYRKSSSEYPLTENDWESGAINGNTGEEFSDYHYIRSGFIPVYNFSTVDFSADDGFNMRMHVYDASKNWLAATRNWTNYERLTISSAYYVRICGKKQDGAPIAVASYTHFHAVAESRIAHDIEANANSILSHGQVNFRAMAKHFTDIAWTPIAQMPMVQGEYDFYTIGAGETQTGIPYSASRDLKRYIGSDLSIYTFMSALKNPKSVLYKRVLINGRLGATYYGSVCDQYPNYIIGFPGGYLRTLYWINELCDEVPKADVQCGDMLICGFDYEETTDAHLILVTDVIRDVYGRVQEVVTSELFMPKARVRRYSYESFLALKVNSQYGYKLYRIKDINAVNYSASDFVKGFPDETIKDVVFPDIMPELGDKASIEAGTDVTINIINNRGYNQILVYKDNVLIDTKNTIADFTMSDIQPGKYTFAITNGSNSSESYLIAADVNGTYNSQTGVLTFSSSNSTPVMVESYADETSFPTKEGVQNRQHVLTAEEVQAGTLNVSEIVSQKFPHIRVSFVNEYGSARWDSYTITAPQWEEFLPLNFVTQPQNISATAGSTVTWTVAVDSENVTYQWQYKNRDSAWADWANGNDASLTKTPSKFWNGWKIRCIVRHTGKTFAFYSDTVTLTVT